MIAVTKPVAFMLYLAFTFGTVIALWILDHFRNRKKKLEIISKELLTCEFCRKDYLVEKATQITQCPQCSCLNKK